MDTNKALEILVRLVYGEITADKAVELLGTEAKLTREEMNKLFLSGGDDANNTEAVD